MPAFVPSTFTPHPFFANQHVQTILAVTAPRRFADEAAWRAGATTHEVALPDGDRLAVTLHTHPDDPGLARPLVVLFHGLEGAIDAPYVVGMSVKAHRLGYHTLRVNFRNCGDTEHLSRQLYTSLLTADMDAVFAWAQARGFARFVPVGVSMSANMLLALLADYGDAPPAGLLGAVAVSPPIEQTTVSRAFGEGLNRGYDAFFLVKLRRKMARRAAARPDDAVAAAQHRAALDARTLRDFDEAVTAPAVGLPNADAYYVAASAAGKLDRIRVKTLLIHAQDDPFLPFAMFERHAAAIAANPALQVEYPRRGGHVGFVAAPWERRAEPWMDEYWVENEALRYVRWLESEA